MRLRVVVLAAALLLVPTFAAADDAPAPEVSLERRVADANVIVSVQPEMGTDTNPGDVYAARVVRICKGDPETETLRVRATVKHESTSFRVLLFLDSQENGVWRASSAAEMMGVSELHDDDGVSWRDFGTELVAGKLVELQAPALTDAARAALWEAGLRTDLTSLQTCLLRRIETVALGRADTELGPVVGPQATATWKLGRTEILGAAVSSTGSKHDDVRQSAFAAFAVCRASRAAGEGPIFATACAAARECAVTGPIGLRREATRLLVADGDASAADAVLAAMRVPKMSATSCRAFAEAARDLVLANTPRKAELLGALVALLARPDASQAAVDALRNATGLSLATPDEWRAWWAKQDKPARSGPEEIVLDEPWTDARAAAAPEAASVLARLAMPTNTMTNKDVQTNAVFVVPDERFTLLSLAARGPRLFVLDDELNPVKDFRQIFYDGKAFGVSRDGERVLVVDHECQELAIPSLTVTAKLTDPERLPPELSWWGVHSLAAPAAWVLVSWGDVVRLDAEPLHVGAVAKPALSEPIASTMDDATGLLVMIGDSNRIEGFDVKTMKSVFTATLPCGETAHDVRATGGTAWIGTKDGSGDLLEFDLRARTTRRRYRLGLAGAVDFAWCSATNELAVADVEFRLVDGKSAIRLLLKVLRLDGGRLVPVASRDLVIDRMVNDVALLGRHRTVVLAKSGPTLAWKFAK